MSDVFPLSFGIVAEGITDQRVIKNILEGAFGKEGNIIRVNFVQPPNDETTLGEQDPPPGGWTLILDFLRHNEHLEALAFNDYIIFQIDTDVSQEIGFNVPHHHDGKARTVEELHQAVSQRLVDLMESPCEEVIFAISVHSLECWLLPLLESQARKQSKTTGCLQAANHVLKKQNKTPLSKSDGKAKDADVYDSVSSDYRKEKTLKKKGRKNSSLNIFIDALDALATRPAVKEQLEALRKQREDSSE